MILSRLDKACLPNFNEPEPNFAKFGSSSLAFNEVELTDFAKLNLKFFEIKKYSTNAYACKYSLNYPVECNGIFFSANFGCGPTL
jgi:hypothetical protein